MQRINRSTAGLVAALALIGQACGGDADEPAPKAANGKAQSGNQDVDRFLLRKGEQPGFRPDSSATTIVGVTALAKYWELPRAEAQQLRNRGFISFTRRETLARKAGGVSEVMLFKTAEGARSQMAYDLSATTIHAAVPKTKIRRFTVRDVPGARGWTGTDLHGNPIGTLYWIQGRCVIGLASEGEVPFVETLSAGAQAVYERTGGDCP